MTQSKAILWSVSIISVLLVSVWLDFRGSIKASLKKESPKTEIKTDALTNRVLIKPVGPEIPMDFNPSKTVVEIDKKEACEPQIKYVPRVVWKIKEIKVPIEKIIYRDLPLAKGCNVDWENKKVTAVAGEFDYLKCEINWDEKHKDQKLLTIPDDEETRTYGQKVVIQKQN